MNVEKKAKRTFALLVLTGFLLSLGYGIYRDIDSSKKAETAFRLLEFSGTIDSVETIPRGAIVRFKGEKKDIKLGNIGISLRHLERGDSLVKFKYDNGIFVIFNNSMRMVYIENP